MIQITPTPLLLAFLKNDARSSAELSFEPRIFIQFTLTLDTGV